MLERISSFIGLLRLVEPYVLLVSIGCRTPFTGDLHPWSGEGICVITPGECECGAAGGLGWPTGWCHCDPTTARSGNCTWSHTVFVLISDYCQWNFCQYCKLIRDLCYINLIPMWTGFSRHFLCAMSMNGLQLSVLFVHLPILSIIFLPELCHYNLSYTWCMLMSSKDCLNVTWSVGSCVMFPYRVRLCQVQILTLRWVEYLISSKWILDIITANLMTIA